MDVATRAQLLQDDWAARESIAAIQAQLARVVEFINRFHASTANRLALLDEKMYTLERKLRYVEAAVRPPVE